LVQAADAATGHTGLLRATPDDAHGGKIKNWGICVAAVS
jgi:hypothetical protein